MRMRLRKLIGEIQRVMKVCVSGVDAMDILLRSVSPTCQRTLNAKFSTTLMLTLSLLMTLLAA